jgi:hypothetical protein
VQFGARPIPIDGDNIPQVEKTAIEWFGALTEAFGPAFENRDQTLASSPTAMAALGAVGHPLIHIEAIRRRRRLGGPSVGEQPVLRPRSAGHELRPVGRAGHLVLRGIRGVAGNDYHDAGRQL